MPALELDTKMFLDAEPHVHYLPFAVDDPHSVLPQDMTDQLIHYPGVGKGNSHHTTVEVVCYLKPGTNLQLSDEQLNSHELFGHFFNIAFMSPCVGSIALPIFTATFCLVRSCNFEMWV